MNPLSKQKNQAQSATVALFVSDLHLDASRAHTTACFLQFLQQQAMHSQALYLLGDVFEYWAGDDDMDAPEHQAVLQALAALHQAGVALYWIAGNRDFLLGAEFAAACHLQLLPESHILQYRDTRIVLTHGDALCTDDIGYMAFRAQVRQSAWQQQFLGKPLAERKAIIAALRKGSRMEQQNKSEAIMDVNPDAVLALFENSQTSTMIHGHTHRPDCHQWQHDGVGYTRHVLPDWECDHADGSMLPLKQARGGWIALHADGKLHACGLHQLQSNPIEVP